MRLAMRSRRAVEDHLGLGNLVRVARVPTKVCGAEGGSSDGPKFREHSTGFKSRSSLVDNVEGWRKGAFVKFLKRVVVGFVVLSLLLSACGESFEDVVQANPLANPTLSFGEQVNQVTSAGSPGGLVGGPVSGRHLTSFEFDSDRADEAFEEIRVQAEAAGYELERSRDSQNAGNWAFTGEGLLILTILIIKATEVGRMQVTLL